MTTDMTPLAAVAAMNLAAAMSPGPAFVLITRTAAASTRSAALKAAAGTVAASLIWATAALLGLQVILTQAAGLYRAFQLLGGLYLCLIGVAMWRHAPEAMPTASGAETHGRDAFTKGLLLGLSNPKVVVFFGTIFTTAFARSTPTGLKWAALLVVFGNESVWYGSLALCFGSSPVQRIYGRVKTSLERIFGALLMVFGVKLAWQGAQS
jgi:threonine/homoserine/homoserine lactone efflux protein